DVKRERDEQRLEGIELTDELEKGDENAVEPGHAAKQGEESRHEGESAPFGAGRLCGRGRRRGRGRGRGRGRAHLLWPTSGRGPPPHHVVGQRPDLRGEVVSTGLHGEFTARGSRKTKITGPIDQVSGQGIAPALSVGGAALRQCRAAA